jgi:ADP-ribose pyrophosphatase YjhB (NUDIX family)
MSQKVCDHTSVGMIVRNHTGDILLIERKKPPYGFAAPAGHVDGDDSYEVAARRELQEEVGLDAGALQLVIDQDVDNPCRRQDGTWHHWKVYEVVASGTLRPSQDETKQAYWASPEELKRLTTRTRQFLAGTIPEAEWDRSPGLEPVWYEHFQQLGIV